MPWKDRIFTPLVTLWVFLGQVLNADHSCRAAVARLIAQRVAQGLPSRAAPRPGPTARRGSDCRERFFAAVARLVGRNLDGTGRRRGGSGRAAASACSTARRSPCPTRRRTAGSTRWPTTRCPGRASPSRGSGPIISLVVRGDPRPGRLPLCRQGPGRGGPAAAAVGRAPPRRHPAGRPPDVGPGSGWSLLKQRGVDTVSRLSAHRRADFRKGTRLGKDDHLVVWKKPTSIRSVDRETSTTRCQTSITVREVRFRVEQPGFRTAVGRRRDDAAGRRAGEQGGAGTTLPGEVEQRSLPSRLHLKIQLVSVRRVAP